MVNEILETTKNIKTISKNLTIGKNWLVGLKNKKGTVTNNRLEINAIATQFYSELYHEKGPNITSKITISNSSENIPPLPNVIKNSKQHKAPKPDGITNDPIKYGGEKLRQVLLAFFNKILTTQKIPKSWKNSDIILIFKEGDRLNIENYRPISLSDTIAKIFSSLWNNRLKSYLEPQQPVDQAGFRKSFSTIDHLHTLNQTLEKCHEYHKKIYLLFIDYTKAYDFLKHDYMLKDLTNQGVPRDLVNLLKQTYSNIQASVITDKVGTYFKVDKGVKQGDPSSPLLFNYLL